MSKVWLKILLFSKATDKPAVVATLKFWTALYLTCNLFHLYSKIQVKVESYKHGINLSLLHLSKGYSVL